MAPCLNYQSERRNFQTNSSPKTDLRKHSETTSEGTLNPANLFCIRVQMIPNKSSQTCLLDSNGSPK